MAIPLRDPDLLRERAYLAGQWTAADSGATVEIRDPASGEPLVSVPDMGAAETRRAIEAAGEKGAAGRAEVEENERKTGGRRVCDAFRAFMGGGGDAIAAGDRTGLPKVFVSLRIGVAGHHT